MDTKQKNQKKSASQLQEEAFREKEEHYLVCFTEVCPLREQCLRWLVGKYADDTRLVYTSVNLRNPKIGGEHCAMFRKNQRVMMKIGLTRLYHEMPTYMERGIRQHLIRIWGRRQYFDMRRGDRLITPQQQQDVVDVCRLHGWTGPIVFDGEREDWLW